MAERHFDRWYCEICGTVGAEEYFDDSKNNSWCCPKCGSEDVFPDYELFCPSCGSTTYKGHMKRYPERNPNFAPEIVDYAEEAPDYEGKICPVCERGKWRKCAARKINWPPKANRRPAKGENNP